MEKKWTPQLNTQSRSVGAALAAALENDIRNGVLMPGQKLPPQRELADQLGINLSTVTRAFRSCELKGLIHGVVGKGTFVTADAQVPLSLMTDVGCEAIDMGQVLPLPHMDHRIAQWVQEQAADIDFTSLIRYPEPSGLQRHRETGAFWLGHFGISATWEDIVLTPGTQNALTNCLLTLFRPGDRIAVDALTYPGFKSLAAIAGIRLVPIPMTPEGMSVQGLYNACRNEGLQGIYLMPEVQNPTTQCMSEACRKEIAALIRKHGLILMEDDTYSYTGDRSHSPVSAMAPEHSIYMGGTSKLIGPGFRITFAKVPPRCQPAFSNGLLSTTWMASPICAELITRHIRSGSTLKLMELKRQEAARRQGVARQLLGRFGFCGPEHGYFGWLPLPQGMSGRAFELAARAAGVNLFCADKFAVGGDPAPAAVRLSLSSTSSIDELERGLRILNTLLTAASAEPVALL